MPTTAQQDRLRADISALSDGVYAMVENGPSRGKSPIALVLAIAAAIVALGAAGIATGLAAADGRAELVPSPRSGRSHGSAGCCR